MYQILLVIHVLLTLALIVVILVQRSSNDGFGMGSGSGGNLMTGRGSANLLTRMTALIAGMFIINSLALGILMRDGTRSITDDVMQLEESTTQSPTEELTVPKAKAEEKIGDNGDAPAEAEETPDISVPKPGAE